jgi:hypothetical protein
MSCLDTCATDQDCAAGSTCIAVTGQPSICTHYTASNAMALCTQAATAANASAPMGIANFYSCIDTGIAAQMEDPDDFCGSAQGGGPFDAWFYDGASAGQVWSLTDSPSVCAPTTQIGTW